MTATLTTTCANTSTGDPPPGWGPDDINGGWRQIQGSTTGNNTWWPGGMGPYTVPYTSPWTPINPPIIPNIPDPSLWPSTYVSATSQAITREIEALEEALRVEFGSLLGRGEAFLITSTPDFELTFVCKRGVRRSVHAKSLIILYREAAKLLGTICEYVEE
jgi:hypothetical protein